MMKNALLRGSKFGLAGAFLLAANYSWGSTAACTTTAALSSYGASTTGDGCYSVDQTFSLFSVSSQSTGAAIAQTTTTDDIGATSGFSAITTPWSDNATFTPAIAADWSETSSGGQILGGTLNYVTDSQHSLMTDPSYQAAQTGYSVFIKTASLAAVGTTGNSALAGGDSMSVTEILCIGTAACVAGGTGNEITLTETWANNISTPTLTCTITGSAAHATCAAGVATFTLNVTQLNVTDIYTMAVHLSTGGGSNTTDTLTSFTNDFTDGEITPEPSTFILMGSALAGVAALRFRKRNQA